LIELDGLGVDGGFETHEDPFAEVRWRASADVASRRQTVGNPEKRRYESMVGSMVYWGKQRSIVANREIRNRSAPHDARHRSRVIR